MSFQYLQSAKEHGSESKTVSRNPSQAVDARIFQLNTDVAAFRYIIDTIDYSSYTPEQRDKLDTISQDIMLVVKETLDKLFDYFGWPYDSTSNASLTRDEEIKGHKLAKDFQAVLDEFRKVLQLAAGPSLSQIRSPSEIVAAGIIQINNSVSDYRSLVAAIGVTKDTPEHRKKLQETKHHIIAIILDTSAKLKALSELEQRSNLLMASSTVKSKNRVTKMKKVFKRWWKSDNLAPEVSEGENNEVGKLSNDFQVVVQEFQKARALASKRSSSNGQSSISTEGSENDMLEAQPFLLQQKWDESTLPEMKYHETKFEEWIPSFKEIEDQVEQVYAIVDTLIDVAYLAQHEQAIVAIDDVGASIQASHAKTRQAKHHNFLVSTTSTRLCSSWCWWLLLIMIVTVIAGILLIVTL